MVYSPKDERDEGDGDNQQIQKIESTTTKSSWMQNETVGDDFQAHLDSEDAREKVIKVVQYLKGMRSSRQSEQQYR